MYNENKFFSLSSSTLKLLAFLTMLIDHTGFLLFPDQIWLRCVGRIAFPIFAFQIAEGYLYTKNYKKYAKRLLLFSLISEIPFNLMVSGNLFYPYAQNVLFTLFLGLFAIKLVDQIKQCDTFREILKPLLLLTLIFLFAKYFSADYGTSGIAMILVFYIFRNFSFCQLGQLIALYFINVIHMNSLSMDFQIAGFSFSFPLQGFAVLALIPIWMYNGRKGYNGKYFRRLSYLFYPVHMFILYIIYIFCFS